MTPCIRLDTRNLTSVVSDAEISALQPRIRKLHEDLEAGKGKGADYLGWLRLATQTPDSLVDDLERTAAAIRNQCDAFVCIGIGGSYLGARAAIAFMGNTFADQVSREERGGPAMLFAGQNISSDYHADLMDLIRDRDVCLNVISKSGTTTEPAIAFRLLKEKVEQKYGKTESRRRIFVTTDQHKGALKKLADNEGYKTFVIPDDVGGRYSVLTPVGLLPISVSGIDIRELLGGAKEWESLGSRTAGLEENLSYLYAAIRYLMYQKGKSLEILASFHPSLGYLLEWWKQLTGESEGKEGKGLFPASVQFTTDLHSLGQWIQEGNRIVFETFLLMESSRRQLNIPPSEDDGDGLNYLAGKSLDFVNDKAYKGTAMAHLEGGVPNLSIHVKGRTPRDLGQLIAFFERAVAMTGYLLEINPFDQPGVEFYKKNMFTLLKKPGFEKGK
ncbi:MAG: glucose-6-phosphate isomerase [Nitrospinae bacterium CG11_big_fil_rev_8_21_14_0_20_56_8]|nr:MAG: glucose-6-phosphate isomerase [Nitrospinae bacterium CG11_big_fil_rev_8_21_14_0_20_56_8]